MNPMEAAAKKQQEREALRSVIAQWNANRLDLFELSEPNEDLEFHGVMRFYFQDSGQKVATKCIRVASDATSQAVIETLIEKFRADMRMLSLPEYALYEIHENGDERRLGMDEKPLLVQLNWHMDDREGRFLLRRIDDKTNVPAVGFQEGGSSFRRKLSKREKKQLKKQEKLNKLKTNAPTNNENDSGVAEKLYTELPETSFTRSISNPEAVMRRRRQQKLERKLQQFRSKDGGPDTGGTLKIYGESLCRDVPYKTLLLSVRDTAQQVVKEMLTKYGLDRETDPHNYCLVQVNAAVPADNGESKEYHGGTNNREYILDDDECPLAILMNHPSSRGSIMFHVRRRPADYHPRKRKKKPQQKWNKGNELLDYRYEDGYDRLPFFLELNPDGSDIVTGTPKRHRLQPNVTEVGSERPINTAGSQQHGHQSQSLQLFGPNVQPRHCVIAHTEGIVTVTPCSGNAETYVNGQRIYETTILQNGAIVKFGRIHNFRFIDPSPDDKSRQRHDSARQTLDFTYDRQSSREDSVSHGGASTPGHNNNSSNIGSNNNNNNGSNGTSQNYETTFDVDGNVETVSTSSLGNKEETRSQRSVGSSRDGNRLSNYERYPRGTDPILPAVLEFREETEEAFLHAVITDLDPATPHFKLAPTYTLYLVARYRASTHYRPELTPTERAHRLTVLLARVATIIHNVIQEKYADAKSLAFWMANSSELLHFLKSDRHISAFSLDAQDILADCVQIAFKNLVSCLQGDLAAAMPHFMSERDDNPEDENTATVLQVLTSAMALLRRCRVNAALTIQLFSQLFHFMNMWAFNKVVTSPTSPHPQQPHSICYCTRAWGLRLKSKMAQLEAWAERQGLELAADCHLARIIQAAHVLQAPKYNADDLRTLGTTCFKLNSLQLRALLSKYQPAPDEPRIPHELIENVVRVAENVADELARADGREVRLEEERELQLPFLLPEDGYSCDVVRGVPQGLAEFLAPLQHAGLCRMSTQPTSSGLWTIYMTHEQNPGARSPSALSNRSGGYPPPQQEPEIQVIKLNKSNNGMGLSIVAAKGAGQDRLGIYIKSVVKGGAADADGQLQAGDQLLKVDGQSLVGITQEKAAEYLVRTGPTVTLEVAKQGAIYHGLATLLQQPSPVMGRGPRRMSERDLPSRLLSEQNHNGDPRRNIPPHAPIQSSKSVPSLNSGNNDLVHGPASPGSGPTSSTPGSKQHEVFNPGYSRTSSTNSIPQKTYEVQPQPASGAGLRSKSSQNLNDPRSPTSALPPTGLNSRQSSNPSLHHSPHPQSTVLPHHMNQNTHPSQMNPAHPSQSQHPNHHPSQPMHPSQIMPQHPSQTNPHASQNQHQQHPGHNQHMMNHHLVNQHQMNQQNSQGSDGERFYQNLSIYRNQELHNGYPPPSPNRGKLPSPQAHEDRSPTHQQKSLRGSQSSLHRPPDSLQPGTRDRPASAYIPQKDQYGSPQHAPGMAPRSQSTRDIIRQEAKLQEMQEEVRRREMRGGVTSPQHYPVQPAGHPRPQVLPNHPQRVPNNYQFHNQDPNSPLHPQHNPMLPYSQSPGHSHPQPPNNHPLSPSYNGARPHGGYVPPPTAPKPSRYPGPMQAGAEMQRPNYPADPHHQNVVGPDMQGQVRPPLGSDPHGSVRPSMPPEDVGYRDSPPPPPPPTSTHPLYQSGGSTTGQKANASSGNPDNRYTASMGEPPRGTYYPASPGTGNQPLRHYQFNATNPWEREEREKEQQRRREAARAWRDQQISELSSLPQRTPQQEEQLRALKLEREFQRRAEECARQEEDEEGEEEQESVERVQGLLRMATQQQDDTDHSRNQQQNTRRPPIVDFQQNGRSSMLSPPKTLPKPQIPSVGTVDEKEKSRRVEELKRKQTEVDSNREQDDWTMRRDEEVRQQHQHQGMQQPNHQPLSPQHSQNQMLSPTSQNNAANMSRLQAAAAPNNNQYMLSTKPTANPSHLRLDNLVINGPASPPQVHHSSYQTSNPHQQYNGYLPSQPTTNNTTQSSYYQQDHNKLVGNSAVSPLQNIQQKSETVNYYHQDSNANSKMSATTPVSPLQSSGTQRLDSLLLMGGNQQSNSLNDRNSNAAMPPQPPERGSSFTVMSQTQGVLRNSTTNMTTERSNMVHSRGSETNPTTSTTSTTIKRVSFHDPNANQPPPQPTSQPPMEQIREDPNHFINEAETLLASPKSPDGGSFSGNTPGVIGAQEVYKDPRTRLLAAQQHQKLLSTRTGPLPEKLSFKEKMKMFAMETGEDGTPRDKVKISRAQRDIDNLGTPTSSTNNGN
ncbi:afadin isoform X3 [Periplaneta americana]|uniref:afadin isoform X3 n=1 Tax=Periplaneta americana TaxID=6978 RepID=UPI0037E980FA